MTLIVEGGAGDPTAESYCSVEFADRINALYGNSAWSDLDSSAKETALASSSLWLNAFDWLGLRATGDQALQWPRTDATDRDGFTATGVPEQVKKACALAAFKEAIEPGVLSPDRDRGGMVASVRVGSLSVNYDGKAPVETEYPQITQLIGRLVRPRDGLSRMVITVGTDGDADHTEMLSIGVHDMPEGWYRA